MCTHTTTKLVQDMLHSYVSGTCCTIDSQTDSKYYGKSSVIMNFNMLGDTVPQNIFVRKHEIIARARNLTIRTWHHEFSRENRQKRDKML